MRQRISGRIVAFWLSTVILGTEGVGGVLGLVRLPAYTSVLLHLGYPAHLVVGDGMGGAAAPTALMALTIVSWALRPPARRLSGPQL